MSARHWYIDAMDARAGMTFAAYRTADLDEQPALDLPSVFIEPPSFRAIRISHRAIALSATRRSFQYGFFLREKEVAFANLADIVEFTRRCYLRGGGRDEPAPPGIPAPISPRGGNDRGPTSATSREPDSTTGRLLHEGTRFRKVVTSLSAQPPGTAIGFQWNLNLD